MTMRCQIGISSDVRSHGGTRYAPFAFTEFGVVMLSSVLNSDTAIKINRTIVRAFVVMREYILARVSESVELAQIRERMLRLEQEI